MRHRIDHNNNRSGKWLLTFNDMVTLILTFFVLILSMSHIDAGKIREMSSSVKKIIGVTKLPQMGKSRFEPIEPVMLPFRDKDIERERALRDGKIQFPGSMDKREAIKRSLSRLSGVDVVLLPKGISISMGESLLFTPGSTEIVGEAFTLLKDLSKVLRENDVHVSVEGHTDNLPIMTDRFPSNWELSIARAVSVVKYLSSVGGVSPEKLSVAGYADTKPKVKKTDTEYRDFNRRVEIFIKYS